MNISACEVCDSRCCRYFALQIDTPKSREDFENIRWFLAHKDISVYLEKRKWYLEIRNRCRFLTTDHLCSIYDNRPMICRDHDPSDCESSGGKVEHDVVFEDLEVFDLYLSKRFKKRKKTGRRRHGDK